MVNCKLVTDEDELKEAYTVRAAVFTGEQGIPANIVFDDHDLIALHFVAQQDTLIVGTARVVLLNRKQAKVERMAVIASARRRGIGRQIMQFIEDEMEKRRVAQIILHARYDVADFYRSCGYRQAGGPFQEAGIKHIVMRKALDKY